MSRLFIAEKASLAEAVWSAMQGTAVRQGLATKVGEDYFVPLAGHILEQAMPDEYLPDDVPRTRSGNKKWRMEDLPVVPQIWVLHPRASGDDDAAKGRDRKNNEAKLNTIARLLTQVDEVVHLGDPDEEGQLLVDEVLLQLKNTRPVRRLLVNDYHPREVKKALTQLRDNDEPVFRGWFKWALTRQRYDWLFGLNCTRAASIRARELGYEGVLSVGRVQTPTLRLVVERDRAIESFKPIPYFTLVATFQHANGPFRGRWRPAAGQPGIDDEGRLVDRSVADALVSRMNGAAATVIQYEKKQAKEYPPLPLSLNELMVSACARFGCTADEVLAAAQALYEKYKVTSYPRTEVRYLSEAQLETAGSVLAAVGANYPELRDLIVRADPRAPDSSAFSDEKMAGAEHHAIVPTATVAELSDLSELERNVYDLIARSYLAQFFPAAVFMQTKIEVLCADERFTVSGKTPESAGWREIYAPADQPVTGDGVDGEAESDRQVLPTMNKGDGVRCAACEAVARETRPPSRFDEATLIAAMVDLHKYVSDPDAKRRLKEGKGIGTSATRAGIIKELRQRGFLAPYKGSKNRLISTETGRALIAALPAAVSDPTMAGQFQIALDAIASGDLSADQFMATSLRFIQRVIDDLRVCSMKLPIAPVFSCPLCGNGQLRLRKGDKGAFWGCSNFKAQPSCTATYRDKKGKPDLGPKAGKGRRRFGFKAAV